MRDPTRRFSDRVANYVKARPGYPPAIVPLLETACGLTPQSVIADVGSGTGLLAELWLQHGNPVYGVEPNAEMRAAGEQYLAGYPRFTSVDGTAEATTLPAASVDFVTAGQAFHWFDPPRATAEFTRILRPGGWVVLVWNIRLTDTTPFLVAYEQLLRAYSPEYAEVGEANRASGMEDLGARLAFQMRQFPNRQLLDWAGLRSRCLSSSYTPRPGDSTYAPMLTELERLFRQYAVDGRVSFDYATQVYYGQLAAAH